MRQRTYELHVVAERCGIIAEILRGNVRLHHYALYLRNLLPVYQAMEQALRRRQSGLEELAQPSLYRADSIVADLVCLAGAEWAARLPLLPAARRYAGRVEWAAAGPLLIAHCYTRYLGDLSGGQIIERRLNGQFGPHHPALAFTAFPGIAEPPAFASTYRAILDRVGAKLTEHTPVIEEAAVAFDMNIAVSVAVAEASVS